LEPYSSNFAKQEAKARSCSALVVQVSRPRPPKEVTWKDEAEKELVSDETLDLDPESDFYQPS
jgi:hypothetical protein